MIAVPKNAASGKILNISSSPDNNILIATEYGVLRYSYRKGTFNYYGYQGLANSRTPQIFSAGDQYIFNTTDEIKLYSRGKRELTFMHVNWLPELASDMYYEFLSSTYYLEGWGTVGASLTYMYMGKSEYRDEAGNLLGYFTSYDMAFTLSYGTSIGNNLAAGLNFKIIHSSLAKGVYVGGELRDGVATTFAVDGGIDYKTPLPGLKLGAVVQNIGPNVQYIDAAQADPLPRNLKVGLAYTPLKNEYNKVTLAFDINKDLIKPTDDPILMEWHTAVKNIGVEYTYADFISIRGGYLYEYDYIPKVAEPGEGDNYDPSEWKGISYMTFGAGLHYANYAFDFGYIPKQTDPTEGTLALSNIMRFSLTAQF